MASSIMAQAALSAPAAGRATAQLGAPQLHRRSSVSLPANAAFRRSTRLATSGRARITCDAINTSITISSCTAGALFLGRLVFLPLQKNFLKQQGLPQQNGVTHADAGDVGAEEFIGMMDTNDPAGFTIVDTLAWGALGHCAAYWLLATASQDYTGPVSSVISS